MRAVPPLVSARTVASRSRAAPGVVAGPGCPAQVPGHGEVAIYLQFRASLVLLSGEGYGVALAGDAVGRAQQPDSDAAGQAAPVDEPPAAFLQPCTASEFAAGTVTCELAG